MPEPLLSYPWVRGDKMPAENLPRFEHLVLLAILGLFVVSHPALALPAFPGAEGWGAETPGGRGGTVLVVHSLADDGSAGTLRWAVEQPYPRIIVFRVSGIIELQKPLFIGGEPGASFAGDNPYSYLTLAGQSAPGGGVTLTRYPVTLLNDVHDVVIRHLRVRNTRVDEALRSIGDGIELAGAYDVVLDHVSVSWVADEGISIESTDRRMNHDITVQHSLIAEGLLNGGHPSGKPHSRCVVASDGTFNVSIHHNLMISCNRRNPSLAGNSPTGASDNPLTDVRYNLSYNFGDKGLQFGRGALSNVVGNLLRFGPDTTAALPMESVDRQPAGTRIHLAENCSIERVGRTGPDILRCPSEQTELVASQGDPVYDPEAVPFDAPPITPPLALESELLESAGALPHDAADEKFIEDYRSFGGELGAAGRGQDEIEVPAPAPGVAPEDADLDGMPDTWELEHGLDPSDPTDAAGDRNGDGYTNVEEYLTAIAGPASPGPVAPSELRATALSSTEVSLSWRDNSEDETSFHVEARAGDGPFAEAASVGPDVTSLTLSGLLPDTLYAARVLARNATGDSSYSNEAAVRTLPEDGLDGYLLSDEFPDFAFRVVISAGDSSWEAVKEPDCTPATLCVSGAVPGRPEALVRIVGPKPNGYLWPTLVKFTTSRVEVWIRQLSTGDQKHFVLEASSPGSSELPGLFDRTGFRP